jgi:hypothetical protein
MIGHKTLEVRCRPITPEHVLVVKFSDEPAETLFAFQLLAITYI